MSSSSVGHRRVGRVGHAATREPGTHEPGLDGRIGSSRLGNAAKVAEAIDGLRNPASELRATRALVALAKEETSRELVLKALIAKLGDSDAMARGDAAKALAAIASNKVDISAAVPKLSELLWDGDERVRYRATDALGEAAKGGADVSAVIPRFIELLRGDNHANPDHMRTFARAFAGVIAGERMHGRNTALDAVVAVLGSGDQQMRLAAVITLEFAPWTLGQDAVSPAVPGLIGLLKTEAHQPIVREIERALAKAAIVHTTSRNAAIEGLRPLLESRDPRTVIRAIDALGEIARSRIDVSPASPKLRELRGSKNPEIAASAAETLRLNRYNHGGGAYDKWGAAPSAHSPAS